MTSIIHSDRHISNARDYFYQMAIPENGYYKSPSCSKRFVYLGSSLLLACPGLNVIAFTVMRKLKFPLLLNNQLKTPQTTIQQSDKAEDWSRYCYYSRMDKEVFKEKIAIVLRTKENFNLHFEAFSKGNILHHFAKDEIHQPYIEEIVAYNYELLFSRDLFSNTPLHWALANAQNHNVIEIINSAKKHIPTDRKTEFFNMRGLKGNSALHLAVGKGYHKISFDNVQLYTSNIEIAKALLKERADPNLQNESGNTPLHFACAHRDPAMIELIRNAGGSLEIQNGAGYTPIDLIYMEWDDVKTALKDVIFYRENVNEHRANFMQALGALTRSLIIKMS